MFSACPSTVKPSSSRRRLERVPARVLAEHDRRHVVDADRGGVHDLVRRALLQHPVLVDAGLVRERVAPHDRLVRLHGIAGEPGDEPARAGDLARLHLARQPDGVGARVQEHHELLERRVARALADPVDRALHLAGAGLHARERVGDREPEVVVAVHRQHDAAQRRHELVQAPEEARVLVRHRVAHGVRDVDRRRALVDRGGHHLGGELDVGARGVHRRELDVVGERLGVRHRRPRLAEHVLARRLQLVLDVDVGRRDERVDARSLRVAHRVRRPLDVGGVRTSEAGDDRSVDVARDRLDGFEVTRRGDREARLDHVHAEPGELVRDLQLLGRVERDPRGLLPVSQRGVEDDDPVVVHGACC